MRISDFDLYKELLEKESGLSITEDKSYLLDSRLTPVAKKWGFETLEAMTIALRGMPKPDIVKDVVEAMTTNETSFFRDSRPFQIFEKKVLPYLCEARKIQKNIRIWSAASSSGQEAYSLAMILEQEKSKMPTWNYQILGTDISTQIIKSAQEGRYTQFEVQRGLPIQMLMAYFNQEGDHWVLKDEIRRKVEFRFFNLLDNMAALGKFDVVFCRNVLIYFDKELKKNILERIAKQMPAYGFLFLGGAETVMGITDSFVPVEGERGLYALKENSDFKFEGSETL